MKGFYEQNQDNIHSVFIKDCKALVFPTHFHHKIEMLILKRGEVTITCNGTSYDLSDGDIAFFNSYDVHSYDRQSADTVGYCAIIPPEYALRFTERLKNKSVKTPVVRDKALCEELFDFAAKYLTKNTDESVKNNCVELMLSLLESRLDLSLGYSNQETTELVKKILLYLNDNFKGDASLERISKELGYSNAHVSRAFGKYVKKSIPDYVNELRYKEVQRLKKETDGKITELIFQAGFNSLQTYYRYKSKREKERAR